MSFNDPTLRHIQGLQPPVAALAYQFINDLRAAGIPAWISSAVRTKTEQAKLVAAGASKTMRSKHLEGRAFDIDILGYGRDDLPRWWWTAVGQYAEAIGLRWGGRFTGFFDAGHFEL